MRVRRVALAFVSTAILTALAGLPGPAYALTEQESLALARQAYQVLSKGQPEAAISQYSEVIDGRALPPEALANALLNRALAKQQLNQQEEAIADYSAALNLDAMSSSLRATALYNRGLAYHKFGKLPQAIEDYTGALLLNSEIPQAFLSRGQALRESDQLLFALSDFERALLFGHPNPSRVNYLTGLTYEQLNRKHEAKRFYEAALQTDPNNETAKARLAGLGVVRSVIVAADASPTPGTKEIIKPEMAAAVEPPQELLAEATVELPKPTKKNADRIPLAEQAAATQNQVYTEVEGASAEITASTTPAPPAVEPPSAPTTLAAVPEIPDKAEPEMVEAIGPETPAVDTVVTASLPQEEVKQVEDRPVSIPGGWAIQLSSATSEAGAWSTWGKMQKKSKSLTDLRPVVVRADLGKKGIVYRLRLAGYEDQTLAQKACRKLKSSGVNCFVSKAAN